jgi:hypothetical protein
MWTDPSESFHINSDQLVSIENDSVLCPTNNESDCTSNIRSVSFIPRGIINRFTNIFRLKQKHIQEIVCQEFGNIKTVRVWRGIN